MTDRLPATMTVPAAGLRLGASTQQTYVFCQRGELDAQCVNGRWRVTVESVERLAAARKQAPAPVAIAG